MTPSARRWMGFAATALPYACVAVLVVCAYRTVLVHLPPFHADEAGHALPAARMALALKAGEWRAFLDASWHEITWPFFHPWFITSFFLGMGVTAKAARLSSLAAFAAVMALLPTFVRAIAEGEEDRVGGSEPSGTHWATAGWLSIAALACANLWDLACSVMSESLGMLLTLLALYAAARAETTKRSTLLFASGLLAALVFLTKYNYGLPLMGALVVTAVWRCRSRGWRPLAGTLTGMAVPLATWALFMFAPNPARARELFDFAVNRDEGLTGLANGFFYVRSLVGFAGWPVGVVLLAALITTVARRPLGRRLPAVLTVLGTLVMLTLHPNKQERYLVPVLPVAFALCETELAWRLRRLRWRSALWATAAALLVLARDPFVDMRATADENAQLKDVSAIVDCIARRAAPGEPILFLGTTGRLPHYALTWRLLERDGREPEVDLLLFPGASGWDARYRTGYPADPTPAYSSTLRDALAARRYALVATLALGPDSVLLPDWLKKWDAWGQNYVRAMEDQDRYALATEESFGESDARVRIYLPRGARSAAE